MKESPYLVPAGHANRTSITYVLLYAVFERTQNTPMRRSRRSQSINSQTLPLSVCWNHLAYAIRELDVDQHSQRKQQGRGITSTKLERNRPQKTRENTCRVMSVLRNEERVGVQNRSSIYLLKNRIQRWYKHIAKAGIYQLWSGLASGLFKARFAVQNSTYWTGISS